VTVQPSVFVHDMALCESGDVGPRTRVWAFAHIMAGAVVGADCNICDHAFIESGAIVGNGVTVKNNVLIWDRVTIEDDVFLGPNVTFTNDPNPRAAVKKTSSQLVPTFVRQGATVGANATIVCGVTIGQSAFIGAGAVVTVDVLPYALMIGNPARQRGWICVCGRRLPKDLGCSCGRSYMEEKGMLSPSGGSERVGTPV
jgi:UDP-2-acetamido-3-amino-2,3-dideoxy-glucuronate N-acetyltransferase